MFEVKENRSGWVRQTLEGLMKYERLEEGTIELTSENEGDRDLMQRVLAEEARPVANRLRERVLDNCIEVKNVHSWWSSGKIADWQIVSGPWGQSERARGLFRVHYEQDMADRWKRVKQFQ